MPDLRHRPARPFQFVLVSFSVLVMLACLACSDDAGTGTADTGVDATPDVGGDTAADSGLPEGLPDFEAATFTSPLTIDHALHPLTVDVARLYRAETDEDIEIIVVEVTGDSREVAGVEARVVRDRVFVDGLLIEDTRDWFAQDDGGNVWYLGEEVDNYEYDDEDEVLSIDNEGAWETGEDVAETGVVALAGYQMPADPMVGDDYYQEYYVGEAEDRAEVIALDVPVTLADGTTYDCLQTRDYNPLEPGAEEYKYYAEGIGVVVEESTDGGERVELLAIFDRSAASLPDFDGATFSNPTVIDNEYLSWAPGTTWTYEAETEDGTEVIEIEVLAETRNVAGVACAIVHDEVFLDDVLIEDTHDWYAQDDDGNVWYMGEEVDNYNYDDEGDLIDVTNEGAWEAGVDGAQPGIVMWAEPTVGDSYYQEFFEGEAEDMGFVVADDATVTIGDTTYEDCVQTVDWNPLEPDGVEYKFFAPGVGLVREVGLDSEEQVDLVSQGAE